MHSEIIMYSFFSLCTLLHTSFAWEIKTTSSGKPLHWNQSQIGFYYNAEHSGLSTQQVSDAIDAASGAWNDSFIDFQNKGTTTLQQIDYTDSHSIYFEQNWASDPEILALTYTWSNSSGEIIHFDIELNAENFSWSTDGASDKHDLQNTLTHELGHAIGLDHSAVEEATMAPSSIIGETSKRELHEDDKAGQEYIYSHPLENQGSSGSNPPSIPSGSSGAGNDAPDQPSYSGNGSYNVRRPSSACATSAAPLYLLWFAVVGLMRRLR
jgi:hypothetical protein